MNPGIITGLAVSLSMIVGTVTGGLLERENAQASDPRVIDIMGQYPEPTTSVHSPVVAPKPVTATTVALPPTCDDYGRLAVSAGWPLDQIPTVVRVMRAESGCYAQAVGDLDRGVSLGLMQIHTNSWCEGNRYWPEGYLQMHGVLDDCNALLDPFVNLYAALIIWRVGGWEQWTTY